MENVIILGTGCAGFTAGIYTARANLQPLILEGDLPGGQLTTTSEVENFPGFPEGIDGFMLMDNLRKQAARFGSRFESALVDRVDFSEGRKILYAGEKASRPAPSSLPPEQLLAFWAYRARKKCMAVKESPLAPLAMAHSTETWMSSLSAVVIPHVKSPFSLQGFAPK